jgi:hypothetical protein
VLPGSLDRADERGCDCNDDPEGLPTAYAEIDRNLVILPQG